MRSVFETHRAHGPSGPVRSAFEPGPGASTVRVLERNASDGVNPIILIQFGSIDVSPPQINILVT